MEGRNERSSQVDSGPIFLVGRHAEPLAVFAPWPPTRDRLASRGRFRARLGTLPHACQGGTGLATPAPAPSYTPNVFRAGAVTVQRCTSLDLPSAYGGDPVTSGLPIAIHPLLSLLRPCAAHGSGALPPPPVGTRSYTNRRAQSARIRCRGAMPPPRRRRRWHLPIGLPYPAD